MVPGSNPVIMLEKLPIPLPSVVFVFDIVGDELLVLQHTPREEIAAPPSPIIFPPLTAVDCCMLVIALVVIPVAIVVDVVVKDRAIP